MLSEISWLDVAGMLLLESTLYMKIGMRLKSTAQGRGANYKNQSKDVMSLCEKVFELEKLRRDVTAGYCDTTRIDKKGNEVFDKMKKYLKSVEKQLADHSSEWKMKSKDASSDYLADAMKSLSNRIWNKGKNELMSGTKIDAQLISYMLCRACVSAKHAIDIVGSEQWKQRNYDMPTMRRVTDVIFGCEIMDPHASVGSDGGCGNMSRVQYASSGDASEKVSSNAGSVRIEMLVPNMKCL